MKHFLTYGKRATGRPSVADLTQEDLDAIRANFIQTNRTKKDGSIQLAWVRFCEDHADRFGHLVEDHMPATTIPASVVEACKQTRALIGPHRGGAARQRHEGAYVPGTMRRHSHMERRLWAGERASVDDATRNTACWIPWPWGGCECSEKFGVRLGRWQTLVVHDDATGFVPFVSSVFRWHQSYRATDAASVIYQAESKVLQFDHWSIEGGVWQAQRTLEVLGGRFISAKGRPNQKLVENYFGRLWTIMAGQAGDVGRHRAEIKVNSDLYVKARAGRVDPRKHFMSITQAQEAMYAAIQYLNEKRIKSRTYGSWVPQERWENDLIEAPRSPRSNADDFLILPIKKTLTVRNGTVRTTEEGPLSMPMQWSFSDAWLWQYEGRKVTIYFDPLAEWPVKATFTLENSRKPIGQVECINSVHESKDRAVEIVKSIRNTMMTETRVLATRATERTLRHGTGILISTSSGAQVPAAAPTETANAQRTPAIVLSDRIELPSVSRESLAAAPRATSDDIAISLSRRAARARENSVQI